MLMPTCRTMSETDGIAMSRCSHITNESAIPFYRTSGNAFRWPISHNRNMANRRGIPKKGPNWFLREWMDTLGVRQRDMIERCDWSKATASQLYNGVQDYSPKVVAEAAAALNVEPWELLMQPDRAMAIRRLQASAQAIVAIAHDVEKRDGTNG